MTRKEYHRVWRANNKPRIKEYCRKYRSSHPDQVARKLKRNRLRREYGISEIEYEGMLKAQGFKCAICETDLAMRKGHYPNVDHDHQIGRVRGILCVRCNQGIGSFKDNPKLLKKAANYLEKQIT
jgi:hypothetical protein